MRDLQNEYRRKSGVTASDTPNYMAPEVIEGRPALPASDVYACGVILHELLTGAKPYGKSGTALLQQHLQQPIPQLPSPHAQFQPLLEALMAKAPAHRPADGVELAMALAALL
jgi:serine/threonine-protein kinase